MHEALLIGWAQTDITPPKPCKVHGQMYYRSMSYVHDPLTATCLVLENGREQVIYVSCDLAEPPRAVMGAVKAAVSHLEGLDVRKITVNAIHTHTAYDPEGEDTVSGFVPLLPEELAPEVTKLENGWTLQEKHAFLTEKLTALIEDAWCARQPGGVSFAHDYAVVAFNRRPQFLREDGRLSTVMYGCCDDPRFHGFEGGVDHALDTLYTWDECGNLTGVAVAVPCPAQLRELHCFLSADYWCEARSAIREEMGNVFVLPLCGSSGDCNPLDLVEISKNNHEALKIWGGQTAEVLRNLDMTEACEDIGERIADAVRRGYRKAKNRIQTRPEFRHDVTVLQLPLRQVSQADYEASLQYFNQETAKFSPENRATWKDVVRLFEPCGVILRYRQQQVQKTVPAELHTVRLCDAVIAQQPFELFVEFVARIKARAKAQQVISVQLSNESFGYLPTTTAVDGGSYSSKPASTMVGPEGGDILVEETLLIIDRLFS